MSTYLPQSRGFKRLRALSWTTRPTVSTETLVLLSSLFFALVCNQLFWRCAGRCGDAAGRGQAL